MSAFSRTFISPLIGHMGTMFSKLLWWTSLNHSGKDNAFYISLIVRKMNHDTCQWIMSKCGPISKHICSKGCVQLSHDSNWDVKWSNTHSTQCFFSSSMNTAVSTLFSGCFTVLHDHHLLGHLWPPIQIIIYLLKGQTCFSLYNLRTDFIITTIVFNREYWIAHKYRNWKACPNTEDLNNTPHIFFSGYLLHIK